MGIENDIAELRASFAKHVMHECIEKRSTRDKVWTLVDEAIEELRKRGKNGEQVETLDSVHNIAIKAVGHNCKTCVAWIHLGSHAEYDAGMCLKHGVNTYGRGGCAQWCRISVP